MSNCSIIIPVNSDEFSSVSSETKFVNLEQVVPEGSSSSASLWDVYRAWTLAVTGNSPRTYRNSECPVEFEGSIIRFFLGFYAWPSDPELQYSLSATLGTISDPQKVEVEKKKEVFVNNTNEIQSDWYLKDPVAEWISTNEIWDSYGNKISAPEILSNGSLIKLSKECFAGMTLAGKAIGDYYVLTIEVNKELWEDEKKKETVSSQGDTTTVIDFTDEEKNSTVIENVQSTITASWVDSSGKTQTEQLELIIPDCVTNLLKQCPGSPYYLNWCEEVSNRQVYYSSCTGEVIKVVDGVNPHKYCIKIASDEDFSPWLKGLIR